MCNKLLSVIIYFLLQCEKKSVCHRHISSGLCPRQTAFSICLMTQNCVVQFANKYVTM